MKKIQMIIGCEIINTNESDGASSLLKLTLMPLTVVKKVTKLESLIGGSMEDLMGGMLDQQNSQMKDTIYITMGEWRERKYRIGRHVTIELLPDDTTGGVK